MTPLSSFSWRESLGGGGGERQVTSLSVRGGREGRGGGAMERGEDTGRHQNFILVLGQSLVLRD